MRATTKRDRPKGHAAVIRKHTAQISELQRTIIDLAVMLERVHDRVLWQGHPPRPGDVVLTHEEASDGATFAEALKRVNGDHSKIKVKRRWDYCWL